MVELPDIVYGLVGIGDYARMAPEGGTYCPVCIQLAFRVWIPRTLRVGKVGVKVGLKQPSGAGLMLQDLAHLALWVWVQDKSTETWTIFQVSVSVLHSGSKCNLPSHMSTNRHQPPQQQGSRLLNCSWACSGW